MSAENGTSGLGLISLPPGARYPLDGTLLEVDLIPGFNCFVNFRSSILSIGSGQFLRIAQEIIDLLAPAYGIGYRRLFNRGPSDYAAGMEGKWWTVVYDQLYFFLRDVYPWNFLSAPQLTNKVGPLTLEQWIGQEPGRGTLSDVAPNMKLWTVSEEDIETVRQALMDVGIIFDYKRDIDLIRDQFGISEKAAAERLRADRGQQLPTPR